MFFKVVCFLNTRSGEVHRLGFNKISVAEGSYFLLLFAVNLLFAPRGVHDQKGAPSLSQYQALGSRRSWGFLGRGQRYNNRALTSSRAGGSRWAGWQWAAATASEGWRKRWHRRPGARRRRPSGRGSPPSSGTAGRPLPSLQARTQTGERRGCSTQENPATRGHWKTSTTVTPWRNLGNHGLPGIILPEKIPWFAFLAPRLQQGRKQCCWQYTGLRHPGMSSAAEISE